LVHATVIGRFFAGQEQRLPGGMGPGYGHAGCCSLLAIQQVTSVDPHDRSHLHYRASPDQPDVNKVGCGYGGLAEADSAVTARTAQREAERGQTQWVFNDPERVASTALARLLHIAPAAVVGIKPARRSAGRIVYEWKPPGQKAYMIVASRPYWLSFYTKNPTEVAWVVIAAWEIFCN
jgi:hypothetical protein